MRLMLSALCLFFDTLHADITWFTRYDEAVAVAKRAHKPLMLFLTRPQCKVRRLMQQDVFTDPDIAAYLEATLSPPISGTTMSASRRNTGSPPALFLPSSIPRRMRPLSRLSGKTSLPLSENPPQRHR